MYNIPKIMATSRVSQKLDIHAYGSHDIKIDESTSWAKPS